MGDSPLVQLRTLQARRRVTRLREIEAAVRLEALARQVDAALLRASAGAAAVEQNRVRGLLARRAVLEQQRFTFRQDRLALDREIRAASIAVRRPLRVEIERDDD